MREITIKNFPKAIEIFESVFGQLSDGMWENTRSMEPFWKQILGIRKNDSEWITLELKDFGPFSYMTDQEVCEWFAKKMKQIVKREETDTREVKWSTFKEKLWDRKNNTYRLTYFHDTIVPSDVYAVYDFLLGRKERVKNIN